MLSRLQLSIIGVIVLAVAIGGYVWHLHSIIDTKDGVISKYESKINLLITEKSDAVAANNALQANNNSLVTKLDEVTKYTKSFDEQLENAQLEIEHWRNKPPSIKYKEVVRKVIESKGVGDGKLTLESCAELQSTMKAVKDNINYEDL